jgi:hypothetical protein
VLVASRGQRSRQLLQAVDARDVLQAASGGRVVGVGKRGRHLGSGQVLDVDGRGTDGRKGGKGKASWKRRVGQI